MGASGMQQAMPSALQQLTEEGWAPPPPPGPSTDEARRRAESVRALHEELQLDEQRAAGELQHQAAYQQELQRQLDEGCAAAEEQHAAISDSLAALAALLDCLSVGGNLQQPPYSLLSLGVPDGYVKACNALLDGLAGYVQHHSTVSGGDGEAAAARQHQLRCRELEQLQSCLCKEERLRVEDEGELARLQAELEVLQAPPSASSAASLGFSAADLEAEVASLAGRRDAMLSQAVDAAEAAAAAAAGAEALEEQCQQRHAVLMQRVEAKQQVAYMLLRHLARQLLVRHQLQQEQAMLRQVQDAAAAAQEDARLAMQAALDRLPGYQDQAQSQLQAGATDGDKELVRAAQSKEGSDCDLQAMAKELLACRAELEQLCQQVHGSILPAQHAVVAQLAGILYSDGTAEDGQPLLSPPELQEQLRDVTDAHEALTLQANAVLEEVIERSQAPEERQLAEQVLLHFWGDAQQLPAMAAKNQQRLERFA